MKTNFLFRFLKQLVNYQNIQTTFCCSQNVKTQETKTSPQLVFFCFHLTDPSSSLSQTNKKKKTERKN